jgi:hypothetical protein
VREMTITVRARLDCLPKPCVDAPVRLAIPEPLAMVLAKIEAEGGGDLKDYAQKLRGRLLAQDLPARPLHPVLGLVRMKLPAPNELEVELYGN